ncbi:MAG: hydroxymethylglutaryl-CoA reductase, degradative, partial [Phyllobacterium sp.]
MSKKTATSRIENMRNLSPVERLNQVAAATLMDDGARSILSAPDALSIELANGMIENVIGTFQLPLGVATNFLVNGREYLVPMAVEEPSVVAAASYMARIVRGCGGFQTSSTAPIMRAQVQLLGITDPYGARLAVLAARDEIVSAANDKDPILVKFGGGCRDIEVHVFPSTSRGPMVVLHLLVDVRDAMGANSVNTMAEAIAPIVARITGGEVRLRILSNLADLRLARARIEVTEEALATKEFTGRQMMEGIIDASEFAIVDPYRAAT